MRTTLRRTLLGRGRHDGGASAVEYALILAGVAILSIGAIFALGRTAKTAFTNATTVVSTQPAGVLPVVPDTTSAAPGPTTTSAAPTPTTTSPTPTPTRTTPTPTPTPTTTNSPRTSTINGTSSATIYDLNLPNNSNLSNTTATMNPDLGTLTWQGDQLVLNPDNNLQNNRTFTTTVTYTYTLNGVNYTGTITVTVRT
jgi:Flp pilus assembly pilin Flp